MNSINRLVVNPQDFQKEVVKIKLTVGCPEPTVNPVASVRPKATKSSATFPLSCVFLWLEWHIMVYVWVMGS